MPRIPEPAKPKFEARAIFVMDYNDWDALVRSNFPERKDYECVAEHEWNNYSSYYVKDAGGPRSWMTADGLKREQDNLAAWLRRERRVISHHLLFEELIRRGVLELGDYLIQVSW